jgi:hypothetical protein
MGKRLIDLVMDRDEDFLYEDDRAMKLTTSVMVQRCVQTEMADIFKDKAEGDVDTLAFLLERGFKGFDEMSPSELIEEYKALEEKWYEYHETEQLFFSDNDDPIHDLEKDETGEVANG